MVSLLRKSLSMILHFPWNLWRFTNRLSFAFGKSLLASFLWQICVSGSCHELISLYKYEHPNRKQNLNLLKNKREKEATKKKRPTHKNIKASPLSHVWLIDVAWLNWAWFSPSGLRSRAILVGPRSRWVRINLSPSMLNTLGNWMNAVYQKPFIICCFGTNHLYLHDAHDLGVLAVINQSGHRLDRPKWDLNHLRFKSAQPPAYLIWPVSQMELGMIMGLRFPSYPEKAHMKNLVLDPLHGPD